MRHSTRYARSFLPGKRNRAKARSAKQVQQFSKGEQSIFRALKHLHLNFDPEYQIGRDVFDFYIHRYDLVLEYQSSRWHYDPEEYEPDQFDKTKRRLVKKKWRKDHKKSRRVVCEGYRYLAVWERDWRNCEEDARRLKRWLERAYTLDVYSTLSERNLYSITLI